MCNLADCVTSSPPLISRKLQGFGGIWANLRLVRIQWKFLKDFGATPDFQENLGFGVVHVIWGVKRLLRK